MAINNEIKFHRYNKEAITKQYNDFYIDNDFIRFRRSEEQFVRYLLKNYFSENYKNLLDIGCGTGKYTNIFSNQGIESTGIDISDTGIKIAKDKYPSANFIKDDALNLKLNKKFDIIFCSGLSLFNEKDLSVLKPMIKSHLNLLQKRGLYIFVKTTSLTGAENKTRSRFDHKLKSYKRFFENTEQLIHIKSYTLYPQFFLLNRYLPLIPLYQLFSVLICSATRIPLRVIQIYKKK